MAGNFLWPCVNPAPPFISVDCSILNRSHRGLLGATIAAKFRGLDITCGCFGHPPTLELLGSFSRSIFSACRADFFYSFAQGEFSLGTNPHDQETKSGGFRL